MIWDSMMCKYSVYGTYECLNINNHEMFENISKDRKLFRSSAKSVLVLNGDHQVKSIELTSSTIDDKKIYDEMSKLPLNLVLSFSQEFGLLIKKNYTFEKEFGIGTADLMDNPIIVLGKRNDRVTSSNNYIGFITRKISRWCYGICNRRL